MIPVWWQLVWISFYVGGILGVARLLAERGVSGEWVRKFVHIGTGNIILLVWWLAVPLWLALAFGIAFSIVTLLSYRFRLLESIGSVDRRSWGTFFYALSITLLIALYWPQQLQRVAALGILIMTWADALAALVGQTWGRSPFKVLGSTKTLAGSGTMFGVSFVIALLLLGTGSGWGVTVWIVALVVGLVATLLETVSVGGLDNLTVPLGSALLADALTRTFL